MGSPILSNCPCDNAVAPKWPLLYPTGGGGFRRVEPTWGKGALASTTSAMLCKLSIGWGHLRFLEWIQILNPYKLSLDAHWAPRLIRPYLSTILRKNYKKTKTKLFKHKHTRTFWFDKRLTTSKQSIILVSLSSGKFFSKDTLKIKSKRAHISSSCTQNFHLNIPIWIGLLQHCPWEISNIPVPLIIHKRW